MKKQDSKSWLTSTPWPQQTFGNPLKASSLSLGVVLRKFRTVLTPLLLTMWFLSLLTLSLLLMSLKLLAQFVGDMSRAVDKMVNAVSRLFGRTSAPSKPSVNPAKLTRGEELRLIQSLWLRSERYLDVS